MSHSHDHNPLPIQQLNKAFAIGIILNTIYVAVQIFYGWHLNSLSLLSDAGHNFLDVASLLLSLLAIKIGHIKPNQKFSFGYKKVSVAISLLNAFLLSVSLVFIAVEAFHRLSSPIALPGLTIALIAFIGILINTYSAFLFYRKNDHDINIKAAYLHLAADALISFTVLIGGLLIYLFKLYWLDAALSILIGLLLLYSSVKLLKNSLVLLMDGSPHSIDYATIRNELITTFQLHDIHHIHIWALGTSEFSFSAHVVFNNSVTLDQIAKYKNDIRHFLLHKNITHVTLETEFQFQECNNIECNPINH